MWFCVFEWEKKFKGCAFNSPGCWVVLCPNPDILIQMMWTQNGGVPSQVLKVIHDDSDKEIQHLNTNTNPTTQAPKHTELIIYSLKQ